MSRFPERALNKQIAVVSWKKVYLILQNKFKEAIEIYTRFSRNQVEVHDFFIFVQNLSLQRQPIRMLDRETMLGKYPEMMTVLIKTTIMMNQNVIT